MAQTNRASRDRNRRVLVVDDEATNAHIVRGFLAAEGYGVEIATSGEAALRAIELHVPDLILLDVMMPGIDGFATCRRVRDNPRTRHVPIILVTSLNDLDNKSKGQEVGADDFIVKPVERDELMIRVRSMLRIKALHDRLSQKVAELESAKVRLRQLADTDALTSLYNKRYFDQGLERELQRAIRYGNALSLLMVDIDRFKDVNDREGHVAGNAVLQQVASTFVNGVRGIDFVARYGGEEFAIVLPETDEGGAMRVAERLREEVHSHRFLDDSGEPLDPVTVSIGVASLSAELRSAEALVKAADAALYLAKRFGRNRCQAAAVATAVSS